MARSLLEEEPSKYGEEDDQSMETEPINKEGDQSMQNRSRFPWQGKHLPLELAPHPMIIQWKRNPLRVRTIFQQNRFHLNRQGATPLSKSKPARS
ncbi:hypothetical protein PGTUg99_000549 [Puccinia graminis f. sp. tritici]|uniref:Uncharacterized protein n=1 Tax=Puccinia graminis f. sp. tritici TaxID=56615 RepID=A0A5B0PSJ5_PUCGR|nr:hypothetical protein PGTUg99_000549 [Puccinia graminis f. sp. tritici]